ncbi:hypothetical protein ABIE49_005349 [Bradyrhizobium sp. OAE829]
MIGNYGTVLSEVGALFRLPPPLRGRVGERGKPRALAEDARPRCINELCSAIDDEDSAFAMRQAFEQAAPLSLTLPRKGGGNPSAGASLTNAVTSVQSGLWQ